MDVYVAKNFPSVVKYEMKKGDLNGKTFYGQTSAINTVRINGTDVKLSKGDVKATIKGDKATYEMTVKNEEKHIDAVLTAELTAKDNTVSFEITKVENKLTEGKPGTALESGKVAYYCTDFPNAKTCNAKHIIATPHLGASTPESEDNCASMAADELMAYLEQGDIRNSVNLPNAQLQAVYTKVCVIHRNVPAMISALTSVIGEAGANIENMTNASKKDYAYTILDIDGVTDGMIEALTAIDGVLRVRVIEK